MRQPKCVTEKKSSLVIFFVQMSTRTTFNWENFGWNGFCLQSFNASMSVLMFISFHVKLCKRQAALFLHKDFGKQSKSPFLPFSSLTFCEKSLPRHWTASNTANKYLPNKKKTCFMCRKKNINRFWPVCWRCFFHQIWTSHQNINTCTHSPTSANDKSYVFLLFLSFL